MARKVDVLKAFICTAVLVGAPLSFSGCSKKETTAAGALVGAGAGAGIGYAAGGGAGAAIGGVTGALTGGLIGHAAGKSEKK